MKCLIIEDQAPAQRILQRFCNDYGTLEVVDTFSNALSALDFLQDNEVDLIFLDIHLPKLSGIDFIKTLSQKTAIILTTAFQDYALQGYDLDVVDYLLKPFSFERFVKAVQKAKRVVSSVPTNTGEAVIFVKSGHEYQKVELDKILFIRTDLDYTEFVLADKKILSSETLSYWEQTLKTKAFIRAHRSFLVNTKMIDTISGKTAYLKNSQKVPIGRAYKEQLLSSVLKK